MAPSAEICYHVRTYASFQPARLIVERREPETHCERRLNVSILGAGEPSELGFLAILGSPETSAVWSASDSAWEVQSSTRFASPEAANVGASPVTSNDDDVRWFQHVSSPTRIEGHTPAATFSNVSVLRIQGAHLTIASNENVTKFDTGVFDDGGLVGERRFAWVVVRPEGGEVQVREAGGIRMAVGSIAGDVSGTLRFTATSGMLVGPERSYVPRSGGEDLLAGDWTLRAHREDGGSSMDIAGALEATTMSAQAVAPANGSPAFPWLLAAGMAILGAVATAGSALIVARRSTPRPMPMVDAEDCSRLGLQCLLDGRYAEAAHWLQIARAAAPTSLEILSMSVEAQEQIGDREGAIRLQEELVRRVPDGEQLFLLAALQARANRVEEAAASLIEALGMDPEKARDLPFLEEFEPILRDVGVQRALAMARRALGERE